MIRKPETSDDVTTTAKQILDYLQQRPTAADTLEGIAYWWLMQQRLSENLAFVEQAVDELVEKGYLTAQESKTSGKVYSLKKNEQNN
ncbi:MAG: hypothetical protein AMJ53_07975 [Gammaproteobacteria bacterium SG8_11]|nr:MAG: hypothetical protein AMJ53_07975 [Gammaproteobacteria bacterium SG8_11]